MSGKEAVLRIPENAAEIKEIAIKPEVMAAGDHPALLAMAEHLALTGMTVTLVIPNETVSQCLDPLRALAELDETVWTAYEALPEKIEKNENITIVPSARVIDLSGWWGEFSVKIDSKEGEKSLQTSGVALAYRGIPVSSTRPDLEDVVSFSEFLENIGGEKGNWNGAPLKRVAFVLDTEQRDEKWASAAAVRMGLFLKERFDTDCYILCRDLKVSLDVMERDYRRARESGIIFFKYQDTPRVGKVEEGLQINFLDTSAISSFGPSDISLEGLDLVVWQERLLPDEGVVSLLSRMKVPMEAGRVGPLNPQFIGRTPKKGLVVGGDTWFPEYPTDALSSALAAAEQLCQWVGLGTYPVDVERVAEVDPSKCATCLTCFRICPHDSIRVERYGERNVYITRGAKEGSTWEAARVHVETCDGCGLCASECPAKAIQLIYYPDLEVVEFLEKRLQNG